MLNASPPPHTQDFTQMRSWVWTPEPRGGWWAPHRTPQVSRHPASRAAVLGVERGGFEDIIGCKEAQEELL